MDISVGLWGEQVSRAITSHLSRWKFVRQRYNLVISLSISPSGVLKLWLLLY